MHITTSFIGGVFTVDAEIECRYPNSAPGNRKVQFSLTPYCAAEG